MNQLKAVTTGWAAGRSLMGGWCGWFRVFGYGLHIKSPASKALFSERYGHQRWFYLFGWRVRFLMPKSTS